jgi:dolichol kinase
MGTKGKLSLFSPFEFRWLFFVFPTDFPDSENDSFTGNKPKRKQVQRTQSMEVLKDVFTLVDSGQLARAPVLSQLVSTEASKFSLHKEIQEGLNGLAAALQGVKCLGDPPTLAERQTIVRSVGNEYERVVFLLRSNPQFEDLGHNLHTLRPRNYVRNAFHVFNALFAVTMYEFFLTYEQSLFVAFLCFAWYVVMDVARRVFPNAQATLFDKLFASITRPRERYIIPAATWYCLSMMLVLMLTPKTIAQVSMIVLGVGDPAATLIGRTFASRKIRGQKSLAGLLGFLAVAFGAVLLFLATLRPEMTVLEVLSMALVAGAVGAVAELYGSDRVDDNLTIPLSVGAVLSILF